MQLKRDLSAHYGFLLLGTENGGGGAMSRSMLRRFCQCDEVILTWPRGPGHAGLDSRQRGPEPLGYQLSFKVAIRRGVAPVGK